MDYEDYEAELEGNIDEELSILRELEDSNTKPEKAPKSDKPVVEEKSELTVINVSPKTVKRFLSLSPAFAEKTCSIHIPDCGVYYMKENKKQVEEISRRKSYFRYSTEEMDKMLHKTEINIAEREELQKKQPDSTQSKKQQKSHELWANKYQPTCFTELISEAKGNRIILQWLKQWDGCVFHKLPKTETNSLFSSPTRSTSKKGKSKKENSPIKSLIKQQQSSTTTENNSKYSNYKCYYCNQKGHTANNCPFKYNYSEAPTKEGKPQHPLLLLSGSPGIGKTTLINILANHCGYNVIEINASDNRSGEGLWNEIISAMQNEAIGFNNNNESENSNIKAKPNLILLDEIDGVLNSENNHVISQIIKLSEGKIKGIKMKRPIICVCNDPYVPALIELRKSSFVYNIPPIDQSLLSKRISDICYKEDIRIGIETIGELIKQNNGDIRSCLNTLQFLSQFNKTITKDMIRNINIGNKDETIGFYDYINRIFKLERKHENNFLNDNSDYIISKFYDLDPRRLVNVIHNSYLSKFFSDPTMKKTFAGIMEINYMNELTNYISKTQDYSVMGYFPYSIVRLHKIFKSNQKMDNYDKKNDKTNMLKSDLHLYCNNRSLLGIDERCKTVASMDYIPFTKYILHNTIRSVPKVSYNQSELAEFNRIKELLHSYNITVVIHNDNYCLNPSIDSFGCYGNSQRKVLSQQLLIELKNNLENNVNESSNLMFNQSKNISVMKVEEGIRKKRKAESEINPLSPTKKKRFVYIYQEGYTNAVRKKFLIKDLFK